MFRQDISKVTSVGGNGHLIELNATALFVGAGALLVLAVVIAAHNPEARTMGVGTVARIIGDNQ